MKTKNGWISMIVASLWILAGSMALAATNNYNYGGQGFGYGHGAVMPPANMTFTNAGIRDVTVSAGQLSGVNPQTGAALSVSNLLPLKAQSLTVGGATTSTAELDVKGNVNLNNQYTSMSGGLNPGYYVYKAGATGYGMKLQYTAGKYGTMIFGPNQTGRFISFGKVGTNLQDNAMIESMRVDLDNGNVGIGTATPSQKLDVVGTVKATAFVGNGSGLTGLNAVTAETDPQVGANTANYVSKWNGSALVSGTIYDNGKIGIGTTNPDRPLTVNGLVHLMGNSYVESDDIWGMKWKFAGNSDTMEMNYSNTAWQANINGGGVTRFRWNTTKNTSGFTGPMVDFNVNGNSIFYGNVGVGTQTPSQKLDVVGTVKATAFVGSGVGLTINPAQGDIPMLQ